MVEEHLKYGNEKVCNKCEAMLTEMELLLLL
jgi:hypothetical protein